MFSDSLRELAAEVRNVIDDAPPDDIALAEGWFVDPRGAGILQVILPNSSMALGRPVGLLCLAPRTLLTRIYEGDQQEKHQEGRQGQIDLKPITNEHQENKYHSSSKIEPELRGTGRPVTFLFHQFENLTPNPQSAN